MAADVYTSVLQAILMGTGNDNNSWGSNLNTGAIQILEDAIVNTLTSPASAGALGASNILDLTGTNPSAARWANLIFTGAITAAQTIKVPAENKTWLVSNQCTGLFTVNFKTPSGPLSTAVPPGGGFQLVLCDGFNVFVSPFNFNQITMGDGSISAPPYSSINEPNSGWRRAGTQDWRLTINGGDVVQVTGPGAGAPSAFNIVSPNKLYFNGVPFDQTATVPSGVETFYAGIVAPSGWQFCNGQAISRSTFANLLAVISAVTTGNTHGSTTIDGIPVDLRNLGLEGAFVEIAGASIGTTVVSTSVSSIVVSPAITGTASGLALRLLPYGQGDGSTNFNLPDRRGTFIAGRDNMGGTAANKLTLAQSQGILGTKLNATGGEQGHTLVSPGELPAHIHTATDSGHLHAIHGPNHTSISPGGNAGPPVTSSNPFGSLQPENYGNTDTATANITIGSTGSSGAHNNVPPASISNVIIKS